MTNSIFTKLELVPIIDALDLFIKTSQYVSNPINFANYCKKLKILDDFSGSKFKLNKEYMNQWFNTKGNIDGVEPNDNESVAMFNKRIHSYRMTINSDVKYHLQSGAHYATNHSIQQCAENLLFALVAFTEFAKNEITLTRDDLTIIGIAHVANKHLLSLSDIIKGKL